jgi:cytochrome c6
MKKLLTIIASTLLVAAGAVTALAASGEELFKQHCAVCHPDGGNIIKPQHTLQKKNLAHHGIKNWQGIVKTLRNPGPGMTKFDQKAIPDKDAKAIAEYVLKTFK